MLTGRLRSEGLFAIVVLEYHVGNNWVYSTALGGAKVQVLLDDVEAARSIESDCRAGKFKSDLQSQFGDLDELRCPKCGSHDFWKRRPLVQGVLAVTMLFLVGLCPPWNWLCFCNNCGTTFKTRYGLIGKAGPDALFALTIAAATLADVSDIHRIRMAARENILSDPTRFETSDIAKFIQETGKGWVCKIDGVVRGFSFANPQTRNIWALFVDPDFERCGIGRELHNRAVDWSFEKSAQSIWLTTTPGTKAERFCRAAGWKLIDAEANGDYRFELEPEIWNIRRRKF